MEYTTKNELVEHFKKSSVLPKTKPQQQTDFGEKQREIRRETRRERAERARREYEARLEREQQEAEEAAKRDQRIKIIAAIGAVAVTLIMIHFFGLLGPAIFGLLVGGLLKR